MMKGRLIMEPRAYAPMATPLRNVLPPAFSMICSLDGSTIVKFKFSKKVPMSTKANTTPDTSWSSPFPRQCTLPQGTCGDSPLPCACLLEFSSRVDSTQDSMTMEAENGRIRAITSTKPLSKHPLSAGPDSSWAAEPLSRTFTWKSATSRGSDSPSAARGASCASPCSRTPCTLGPAPHVTRELVAAPRSACRGHAATSKLATMLMVEVARSPVHAPPRMYQRRTAPPPGNESSEAAECEAWCGISVGWILSPKAT
mmetsp:Transcript_94743/g.251634  ORF Transcript_94743/g.251634 Transcript_94743/m.251634 type:complete len:256 (+) Transcript_94743:1194-1961(+)